MTLRSKHLAPAILAVFAAGISATMALNLWQTTSSKVPLSFQEGEFAGRANPADIRGSYSFADISAAFPVPVEALARAFDLPPTTPDPAAFLCKQLEEIYAGTEGGEIGTDSVRWFVALYAGLPYSPEEDSLLPAAALGPLASRLTPEQLAALRARTLGAGDGAPEPAPEAAPEPAPGTVPRSAPETSTPTEQAVVGEIKGKTTFGELTSWGISREAIEAALGKPMGRPGVSVRDFCLQNGIEFSTLRGALQEAADRALGRR